MGFDGYDVYVKVNSESGIIAINSNAFISDFTDWILIESGVYGDRGHHAQGNYFPQPIYTRDGIPRYKLVDGAAQERTEEEIEADRAAIPVPVVPPSNEELEQENKMLRAQIQAAVDRQDFIEDCIAEMAMQVYAE